MGNQGLTADEYVTHFSLWCLVKSPLILGNDIRNMSAATLAILTNDEVIALNQDPLGVQGHMVKTSATGQEVWAGPLADGSVGVVLFNRNDTLSQRMTVRWADVGLSANATAVVRDLWSHKDIGQVAGEWTSTDAIRPHASVTVRLDPVAASERKLVLERAQALRSEAKTTRSKKAAHSAWKA